MTKRPTARSSRAQSEEPVVNVAAKVTPAFRLDQADDELRRHFDGTLFKFTGATDFELAKSLLEEAKALQLTPNSTELDRIRVGENTDAMMAELKPQNPTEGILISQMMAVQRFFVRAVHAANDPTLEDTQKNKELGKMIKLGTLYLRQMEKLEKCQGRGQQRITVEHVHVEPGAQAVVGSISMTTCASAKADDKIPSSSPTPVSIDTIANGFPHASPK